MGIGSRIRSLMRWLDLTIQGLRPRKRSLVSLDSLISSATVHQKELVPAATRVRDGVREFIECPTLLSLSACKSLMEQYLDQYVMVLTEQNKNPKKKGGQGTYTGSPHLIEERANDTLEPPNGNHKGGRHTEE